MISIRHDQRHKLKEWSRRYLPAEVLGSCAAVTAAWMVQIVSGSPIGAAIAGSIGESLAYYGCIALRDLRRFEASLGPNQLKEFGQRIADLPIHRPD